MPTPAERKALLFLAGVIVLGASVRVVRAARGDTHDDPATRAALARQLAAVDSAHGMESAARKSRPRKGRGPRRPPKAATKDSSPTASSLALSRAGPLAPNAFAGPIDLDVASADAIEALPRIGPVLARRIVEDREANGPFGSLDGLQRVRGVGPALGRQLEGRVTFSGTARPSNAVVGSRLSTPSSTSRPARRARRN
jgi:competence protein ComEA